ncbi:MAG: 50S ribosomal protein L17 [Planctomycetota bacterium]|nr:MAG: 50S ribosomal protein L17 [Planctomycetota bacterium]
MRHKKFGRKLNRTGAHRKALKRNLAINLIEHESIRTTPQKAKFVRPFVEKLITLAKKPTLHNRRRVASMLYNAWVKDKEGNKIKVVNKLFEHIAPRFKNRAGGYTRIVRLPKNRLGDNAPQCLFQLVEGEEVVKPTPKTVEAGKKESTKEESGKKEATSKSDFEVDASSKSEEEKEQQEAEEKGQEKSSDNQ